MEENLDVIRWDCFWECFPLRGALSWACSTLSTCVCVCLGWEHITALLWNLLEMRCVSSRWISLYPWAWKHGENTRWAECCKQTPQVREPTLQVPHFWEALLGEGLRESWVALELQMGQSSQTIQGQRDQLVVSQVPGEGKQRGTPRSGLCCQWYLGQAEGTASLAPLMRC